MKKLVIISNESVFAGSAKTGVGEMTDSLANSVGKIYDTHLICPDGRGILTKFPGNMRKQGNYIRTCRVFGVSYYLVDTSRWPALGWEVADRLNADILHNLSDVDGYTQLTHRPSRMIYSFDRLETIENVSDVDVHLSKYDAVRTGSKEYARNLLTQGHPIGAILAGLPDFNGAVNGIATPAYAPEKGLLITSKYYASNLSGKLICKEKICKIYGIPKDKVLFLMMCHLNAEKGADSVLKCLHTIRDCGGFTLLVGDASEELASKLEAFTLSDGVLWVPDRPNPLKAIPLFAGADFYLCPSTDEPGGLLPMQASRYGTVPIVAQVGALVDNFSEDDAIIIKDGGLTDAIEQAFSLYADADALQAKRKACMEQDFSWNTRNAEYISLYEGSTSR